MWVNVLVAAEEWGVPPWDIAPGAGQTVWFLRWQEFKRQKGRAEKERSRDAQRQSKRKR